MHTNVPLDALPYIDTEYEVESLQKQVEILLQEEMRQHPPSKDYLAHLPYPSLHFDDSAFVPSELERIARGEKMTPMDTARYALVPPPSVKKTDPKAWQNAVKNAQSQIEHQSIRFENLDLLNNYGANSWMLHNEYLEQYKQRLSKLLQQYKTEIEEVNRQRKKEQTEAGRVLFQLEQKWEQLIMKNIEIEIACRKLEEELFSLRNAMNSSNSNTSTS